MRWKRRVKEKGKRKEKNEEGGTKRGGEGER